MSKNINQVFVASPITTNLNTDLMYFGRSPYGLTDDKAMLFSNFSAQFLLNTNRSPETLLGNPTGSPAPASEITIGAGLDIIGTSLDLIHIPDDHLLGNDSGITGAPGAIAIGSGLSMTGGTLSATGGGSGFTWNNVTGTSQSMTANNGYVANNAALVTMTLPVTAAFGTIVEVAGGVSGTGLWTIAQNAGQSIIINGVVSTVGVGGSVAGNTQYSSIRLICVVADTTFVSLSGVGSYTVT